jgi:hypothetical protein
MPVLDFGLNIGRHEQVRTPPSRRGTALSADNVLVVAAAVVLGTIATKENLLAAHLENCGFERTIEGKSRRSEYVASYRFCNRCEIWCGSCAGDRRLDRPFWLVKKG